MIDFRRAEERLRRSEAYLAEGQRISQTGSWAWNAASGELYWSEEHFRICGMAPAAIRPTLELYFKLVHPEDRARSSAAFEAATSAQLDYEAEYRVVRPDGAVRHVHAHARPVADESGKTVEYIGTVMDVTEHKRADEALRRSEAYLAEGQRISQTSTWAFDVGSRQLYWSAEHFRIFGIEPRARAPDLDEARRQVHPDDLARSIELFERAVREGGDYACDLRIVRPDGTIRHVESRARPVREAAGRIVEYVGTLIDVTERRLAQQRVRESTQQLDLILNSITDNFFAFDKDCRFTYLNGHAAAQMRQLGKDPEQLIGRVLWDVFAQVPNEAAVRRVLNERVPVSDELFFAPIGEWVESHMYPTHDGGMVVFQRYVTKRKWAEQALSSAREELQHVNRAITVAELAASIAHELNQPLAAVVANAAACERWLSGPAQDKNELGAGLKRIARDANRASEVISRIRTLLTRKTAARTWLSMEELLRDVIGLVQGEAHAKDVSITARTAPDLGPVMGDRVQLQQVVLNLALNAIDAMAVSPLRRLEFGADPGVPDGVVVSVRDTGAGIGPEHASRMFDAFYTTKPEGMGMGLAISRSIVEAHGGRLWAEPNAGPGMTFRFNLLRDPEA
jgi:PAS domain S-box-containing protein